MTTEEKVKMDIPSFKGKGSLTIHNWIKLFERSTEQKIDDRSKIVGQYLEDEALNFFIERDLYNETWDNIKRKLSDYFSSAEDFSMQHFLNIRLSQCENIEDYFRKKTDAATKLQINEKFLIQILIHGLPHDLKTLNLTKTFETSNEWINYNKPLFYHLKSQESSHSPKKEDNRKMTPRGIPNNFPDQSLRWRFQHYDAPRRYHEPPFQSGYRRPPPPFQNTYPFYWRPQQQYSLQRPPQRLALTGSETQSSNYAYPGVLSQTRMTNSNSNSSI